MNATLTTFTITRCNEALGHWNRPAGQTVNPPWLWHLRSSQPPADS
jgi:hypothetical protein